MSVSTNQNETEILSMRLPPEIKSRLHLESGERLSAAVVGDRLSVVRTVAKYSPDKLLAEHATILDELEDDRAWLDAKPVGRELF